MINITADYMSIGSSDVRNYLRTAATERWDDILSVAAGNQKRSHQLLTAIEEDEGLMFEFFRRLGDRCEGVAREIVAEKIAEMVGN